MSKEKQIEEITELLWHFPKAFYSNCSDNCEEIAKLLYEEGYRKQSKNIVEVVRCKDCGHKGSAFCMAGDFPLTKENENCFCSYGVPKMKGE